MAIRPDGPQRDGRALADAIAAPARQPDEVTAQSATTPATALTFGARTCCHGRWPIETIKAWWRRWK
jgi:hypothetical protein